VLHRRLACARTLEPQNNSFVPPVIHEVLRSPGQPLDANTRAFMEPRFGHDFSSVRVHTNVKAAESARAVDALAYTVGRNIVFGSGGYAPSSSEGRRLLAHELTHVAQQSGAGSYPPSEVRFGETDGSEREAGAAAAKIETGEAPSVVPETGPVGLSRSLSVKNAAGLIPNPTRKGLHQTNALTVEQYLQTICSQGSVVVDPTSGLVSMSSGACGKLRNAPGDFGLPGPTSAELFKEPEGCTCLCDLTHPDGRTEHDWTIKIDDLASPNTLFDNEAAGEGDPPGVGTGGTVTTISPNSAKVFGSVTQSGKKSDFDPWLILGHELCGHAWLGNFGRSESEFLREIEGRQSLTVDRENALRAEHGIEARGRSFRDPFCGESFSRFKFESPKANTFSQLDACKQARAGCKKPGGGTFRLDETIPKTVSCF
jgi:hypothetical protein